MADSVLFVGWGEPVRGREERGLEVFNEAVGMYGRMQQDGRIEGFDVCLLGPNGSDLDGFILLRGSAEQIDALPRDEEFQRNMADATLITHGIRAIPGSANEQVAREMEIYREAVAKVPQTA